MGVGVILIIMLAKGLLVFRVEHILLNYWVCWIILPLYFRFNFMLIICYFVLIWNRDVLAIFLLTNCWGWCIHRRVWYNIVGLRHLLRIHWIWNLSSCMLLYAFLVIYREYRVLHILLRWYWSGCHLLGVRKVLIHLLRVYHVKVIGSAHFLGCIYLLLYQMIQLLVVRTVSWDASNLFVLDEVCLCAPDVGWRLLFEINLIQGVVSLVLRLISCYSF